MVDLHPIKDDRSLTVKGKKYYAKTLHICPACGNSTSDSRPLYIKSKQNESFALECPTCEQVVHMDSTRVKVDNG